MGMLLDHRYYQDYKDTVELVDEELISLLLVSVLLLVSRVYDFLDIGGLIAALGIGLIISLFGHWTWLLVLMSFLIISSIVTKWKYEEKSLLSVEESNDGSRGWKNVVANGGAASIVAIVNYISGGHELAYFAFCACVSVASSDTLASEIGSLDSRTRIITTLAAVPAGTNGGMSPTGTIAAFYGGLIIGIFSTLLGALNGDSLPPLFFFLSITLIGWLGCQIDSLLGALLENKGYLGKHGVNFISTLSGSFLSLYFAYILIY
ncbi:MAG: hypothetical protein ACI9O1_000686 [Candidatus Thalassarchaeaceae archaeon]|jgi:uncharacterized protein (TIGR00297 family)